MLMHSRTLTTTPEPTAELDRLGDEIAELSAHLEAATARLLDLIRDFDARGGWNTGFHSCAAWLSGARGARPRGGPGAGPGGARPGETAALGSGPGARRALVRQGGGPRGRRRPGGSGAARAVRPRGRGARFLGNVSAPGVRCEPGGDAARPGGAVGGSWGPDAHDSARAAAGSPASRSKLSLPGVRGAARARASRAPLGAGRPDHPLEPRVTLSPPSSRRARGGISARATGQRRAPFPAAGRPTASRGAAAGVGARRSGGSVAGAA